MGLPVAGPRVVGAGVTPTEAGAVARARRVALGVSCVEMAELLGLRSGIQVLDYEDGFKAPPCGWTEVRDVLRCLLGEEVDRRIARGERPTEIRIPPWSAADVLDAAGVRPEVWRVGA